MKKSSQVVLVISGAAALTLATGCNPSYDNSNYNRPRAAAEQWVEDSQSYTNNYYDPARGYYHSGARGWYPYPYNHFVPGQGYYSGGSFHQNRLSDAPPSSRPLVRSTAPSTSGSRSAVLSGSVSRGGFGGGGVSSGS